MLIYSYDRQDAWKMQRARDVLRALEAETRGMLTTQILSEFFTIATRKLRPPVSLEDAEQAVRRLMRSWYVLPVTIDLVSEALRGVRRYQFNYWDPLIWAAARTAGARFVLTEDFSEGSTIEGVTFLNPFTESFDLDAFLAR